MPTSVQNCLTKARYRRPITTFEFQTLVPRYEKKPTFWRHTDSVICVHYFEFWRTMAYFKSTGWSKK